MVFLLDFLLNLFIFYFFLKVKKNLHILEIIVYWLVGSYLFQNFSALCFMNFKTIIIPNRLTYELSHFLNRTVLYPVIMVIFLKFFLIVNNRLKKLFLILGFVTLLSGLEWLSDVLGVMLHVHWQVWWSLTFWLVALLMLIVFMKIFQRLLYKGE